MDQGGVEASLIGGVGAPWNVNYASEDLVQATMRALIGIEMPISRQMGTWKVSPH